LVPKVTLLGGIAPGKTSIVRRLVHNSFSNCVEPTIGASFVSHTINVGFPVKLAIWDTAGVERFKSLTPMYYQGASAVIVVYDITDEYSFTTAKSWIEICSDLVPVPVIALVGNKVDLEYERKITPEMVDDLRKNKNISLFFECSAKTGQNVSTIFEEVTNLIVQQELSKQEKHVKEEEKYGDNPLFD